MKYGKSLARFMKEKSLWMNDFCKIPNEWYFVDGDEKEILTWDEKISQVIWEKIKISIEKNEASGLNYKLCPFCYKNNYDHALTKQGRHNPACIDCGYGKRHGICTDDAAKSEFRKILEQFNNKRLNIYKCLSNDYYKLSIKKLETLE
ncbi:MAG: hypothetical protein FWF73_06070 [Spirochaetes bacterium]|nr:hypothetical protein [Spirochaetota bacterium]